MKYDRKIVRFPLLLAGIVCCVIAVGRTPIAAAELSKAHRILIDRGLQLQGMVTTNDVFDLDTYRNANYTAINWLWESNPTLHGSPPGFPWARWVADETKMPGAAEQPYLSQLVALQLGDEWHLNDPAVRTRAVNWFNAIRDQWPNTILYMNNWGGQVNDAELGDFIGRARPDMLAFDTYPFQSDPNSHQPNAPTFGSPTSWYAEMRRYRLHAQSAGIPWAIYRQTFHAIEGSVREYRTPSQSEMNLNTFAALAFGATAFIDFTYNMGASSIAPSGSLQPGYTYQTEINRRAQNLGKTLVHLTGLDTPGNGALPTQDILFLRGQTGDPNFPLTPLPIGFQPDNGAPAAAFSEWAADRNDPYLRGWNVKGCATRDDLGECNATNRGDVIISWLKPLDSSLDDPSDVDDQLYLMVVNGYTGPTGTAADYRQRIQLNFLGSVGPTIQRLNYDTGQVELVNLEIIPSSPGRRRLVLELDGGVGQLLKFNTGHPFLGIAQPLGGDYNGDGTVDAADYVVWRKAPNVFGGDAGYNTWRAAFGRFADGGAMLESPSNA
ncbi:MAG TPA: hypothetical protein VGK58_12590, partial [Lacipirellulaceae bacterium]